MQSHEKSILFCLSPAPSNRMIIQAASDMFRGEGGAKLIALFVETPMFSRLPRLNQAVTL